MRDTGYGMRDTRYEMRDAHYAGETVRSVCTVYTFFTISKPIDNSRIVKS